MTHRNTINSTRLETLSKDNYDTWKIQVEALLIKNDVWGYVSGEIPRPRGETTGDAQAAYNAWIIEDRKAKADLILAINPTELKQVRGCTTSKEVWDKLESIYASKGPARKATLLKRLTQHKMADEDDLRDHLSKFFDAVDKLESMDVNINGDLLTIMLLYSLPSSFENFRCAIESRDVLPDVESLKIKIIEENDARTQKKKESESGALFVKYYPGRNKGKEGAISQSRNTGKQPKSNSRPSYKCGYCKKSGHKYADCYSRKKKEAEKTSYAEETYLVSTDESSLLTATDKKVGKWCLDSGCTSHLCNDKQLFSHLEKTQGGLKLASNATAQVKARGDVKIITSDGNTNKSVKLENTLYVPDLRANLLSVAKIVDKDHQVLFTEKQAIVTDRRGNPKMIADRKGDLFYLRDVDQQACTVTCVKRSDIKIWHERLGHLNVKDMASMAKCGATKGFHLKTNMKLNDCEICTAGKMSRAIFPVRECKSAEILQIVYTDICGQMRTKSKGGARYFMTLIDDYSRWCQVYFLHSKNEATSKFVEYKNFVETQTGKKIKSIQSDNGKEFDNSFMKSVLKKAGIRQRLTTPYTPQQNGVAERKNRTLVESARCMLMQSGLPPSFWAEAIATANHIRNRCTTRSLESGTPYEKWTGHRPDIGYFRIFGCKAYVLDKASNKGKFDPRAIKGIFVGYPDTAKGYRVWIPSEERIIVTRDVTFFNDFDTENEYENIVTAETINGRFNFLGDSTPTSKPQEAQIGGNRNDYQVTPTESRNFDAFTSDGQHGIEEELPDRNDSHFNIEVDRATDINEADTQLKRGPGRPRKIYTGRRGRPAKEYNMINMINNESRHDAKNDADIADVEGHPNMEGEHRNEEDHHNIEGVSRNNERKSLDEAMQCNNYPEDFDDQTTMLVSEILFSEAISGPDATEWKDAIYSEIKSLIANDTWEIVNRPIEEKVIGCRTVLRNKYNADGSLERRKARVVAKGFSQRPGIDFNDTFAPVARLSSLRLLVALSAEFNMRISQVDVTTAYLNGRMDTTVYMEKPELLELMLKRIVNEEESSELAAKAKKMLAQLQSGNKVCKLIKALYGLRQAGRRWHERLNDTLKNLGFTSASADPCTYVDRDKTTFLVVYVDDVLIASTDLKKVNRLKEQLSKAFAIKDLGEARYCLGIEITRNKNNFILSQGGYIRDILARFGMVDCKPVSTPLEVGTRFTNESQDTNNEEEKFPFRELIGSLMYLAQGTRPDIAHAVSALSQWNSNHRRIHWIAAKRVLRYLKGTINLGLHYKKTGKALIGYVDADWGNCIIDRRSYTGLIFILAGAAFSWESRKQRTVALSSTEAEYMGLTDAAKEAIFLIRFLNDLGFRSMSQVHLFNDNQSAGKLARNPVFHARSKHIDVKHHFIRKALQDHPIKLVYISTEQMIADVFTKPLPTQKHITCIAGLGLFETEMRKIEN